MGYKHINSLLLDPDFLLKERVEKMNIVIKKSGKMQTLPKKGVTYAEALKGGEGKNVSSKNRDRCKTTMTNVQGITHKLK